MDQQNNNVIPFRDRNRPRLWKNSVMGGIRSQAAADVFPWQAPEAENPQLSRAFRSVAPGTAGAYASGLRRLDAWLEGRPLTDDLLADYCESLHKDGKAPGTVIAAINAAKFRCRALDLPNPDGRATAQVRSYVKRNGSDRKRGHAKGLSYEQVEAIIQAAEETGTLHGLRDAAIIATLFYCGLRRSEALGLDVEDVLPDDRTNEDGELEGVLTIRRGKTDQTAKGQVRPLAADGLRRIQVWIDAARIQIGPIFRPIHNSFGGTWKVKPKRMNRDAASVAIVKRAVQVGIEGVTSHSFRRAFAQDLLKGGFRTPEIMEAGRWKSSEMVFLYTRGDRVRMERRVRGHFHNRSRRAKGDAL